MSDYEARAAAHREANEAFAPLVKDGWQVDVIGGGPLGSTAAICPVCFAYVPDTNVAKVLHQRWHFPDDEPASEPLSDHKERQQ